MVNPFEWRHVVLAKHAQHVVLVHFPIALFIAGVVFDALARGRRASLMAGAAYLNFSFAALMVVPTAVTGLLAWNYALEAAPFRGFLLWHLLAALSAAVLVIASWGVHWKARQQDPPLLPRYRFAIELLGVVLISITGHLGGFLSGVNI